LEKTYEAKKAKCEELARALSTQRQEKESDGRDCVITGSSIRIVNEGSSEGAEMQ
jgi:hypothetical protein